MESTESTTLSVSATPTVAFSGATSAVNLNGTSIKVSWGSAPSGTARLKVFSVAADGTMTLTSSLSSSQTSVTLTGLTANTQYSYIVQAFDNSGNSDGNQNQVTAFTYAGISGAGASSTSSATFSFGAPGAQASGVNVYCKNKLGTDTLVGSTTSGTVSTLTVSSGLLSGVTYTCHAQAVSASTGLEDTNPATYSFQMPSVGFGQLSGGVVSNSAYQGVVLVQAYGDAPNAPTPATAPAPFPAASPTVGVVSPSPVPTARQVQITWKNFNVSSPQTAQYRLVRVNQGGVFDMNTTTPCASTTAMACQVCVSSYSNQPLNTLTSRTCLDTAVAASPARYQYAVSLMVDTTNMIAEELPTTYTSGVISTASVVDAPFRILVPIPPSNMVLVHRDSANYEMCQLMGFTSDPLNNQRCAYSGLGAIPYGTFANTLSTRLSLVGNSGTSFAGSTNTGTFYDFGYDVFIDRFGAGCNWTPASSGGMCGAGGAAGDCNGPTNAVPASTIGVNGNVFYDSMSATCYVKQSGGWLSTATTTLTTASLQAIYTRAPSQTYQKPPLVYIGQLIAGSVCQAQIDPYYGPSRLMRRREQVAAAAFQWNLGSPQYLSSTAIGSLQSGTNHPLTQACNANTHSGLAAPTTFNSTLEIASNSGGATGAFVIGSHYTAQCVSRFGAQDLVGNVWTWVSDQMSSCSSTTHTCTGGVSSLDPANQDLSTYNFDGVTGPGGTSAGQTSPTYTSTWNISIPAFGADYFSAPLGLVFVTSNSGNALAIGTAITSTLLHTDSFSVATENGNTLRGAYTGGPWASGSGNGRFDVSFSSGATAANSSYGFRCALPAE